MTADNASSVSLHDNAVTIGVIDRLRFTSSVVRVPLPGRFWSLIDEHGPDECWPWLGHVRKADGYATYSDGRYGTIYAHLILWRHMNGPVPDGHEIDHSCWFRSCMNPNHHRPLLLAENRQHHDPARLTTHCPKGHPKSGDNLYVNPRTGQRACRECVREANRQARKRAS